MGRPRFASLSVTPQSIWAIPTRWISMACPIARRRKRRIPIGASRSKTHEHWRHRLRLASTQLNFQFVTPAPSGTPFDGNFLGNPVTIRGANGYTVTGQAILDFGGTYPQPSDSTPPRRSLYVQSNYD